ncbi:type 4a pilus biogenesis protein PilO [Legionella brunensis]|uniref:Type IV pilus biogenesis protein PilO n=1 Tax=Legionella brunensis TaxID=29422 RepID=A0A0W0SLD1_9GAMM|nr:type 4a pilus biogenesis protein PilO [Legionella brunensis]KTC84147.1 type IV pilus biogenesis protein PilO [Legionella brunensis]
MVNNALIKINNSGVTIRQITRWLRSRKYPLVVLIAVLVLFVDYLLVIKPNEEQYENLFLKETELRTAFEKKYLASSNLRNHRAQIKRLNNELSLMLKLLPRHNEISPLAEEIFKTAKNCGLTINFFAPHVESQHSFYVELPIEMAVTGEYSQLALFLSKIASFPYLITFDYFKITKLSVKNESYLSNVLLMKITIKIYRSREK